MERHEMIARLKALRLHGMVAAFDEVIDEGIKRTRTPFDVLSRLLQAEDAERQARSVRYQMSAAKFPLYRDLDSFEFAESPVNEQQIRQLYSGEFTNEPRNIVFVGIATNVCVESTLRDGFHLEYFGVMLEDATHHLGPPMMQEATVYNVEKFFGWVSTTADFCGSFGQLPQSDSKD